MYEYRLEGRITIDLYDKKVNEFNQRKEEVVNQIDKYNKNNKYDEINVLKIL